MQEKNEGNSKFKNSNLKFAHVLFNSTNDLSVEVYLEQNKKQGTLLLNNNPTLNMPTHILHEEKEPVVLFEKRKKKTEPTYLSVFDVGID